MAKKKPTKKTTKKTTLKRSAPNQRANKNPVAKRTTGKKKTLIQRLIAVFKTEEKKKKRENSPARNEFRYNIKEQHTNYVFEVKDDNWKAVGFTHEEYTFDKKICR